MEVLIADRITMDEGALETLFNQHFEDLVTFLNYYTHSKQLIEDTIQEIFIKLWEEREKIQVTYIKTYLYQAARNRILNHLRNQQNRSILLEEWATQTLEKQKAKDCVNREEFSVVYQQAVKNLPERCQEIYRLCKEHHKTYQEVAAAKGLSVKTVEAQMSIASKKIREHILQFYSLFLGVLLSLGV